MKRLILVLTLTFLFVAGSAFSATVNCIMYSSENDGSAGTTAGTLGAPITSDYTFTIETDDITGEVIAFTDLFSNYFYAEAAGGWNTEDSAHFDEGEQIFKNGDTYNVAEITFDGNTIGGDEHGVWFSVFGGPWNSMVANIGIIAINFDGTDGEVLFGPNEMLAEHYIFHAVPIPSAVWLLMSGLVGIMGFRRKFGKEA